MIHISLTFGSKTYLTAAAKTTSYSGKNQDENKWSKPTNFRHRNSRSFCKTKTRTQKPNLYILCIASAGNDICYWHSRDYHVQFSTRSPVITKNHEKWTSKNMDFIQKLLEDCRPQRTKHFYSWHCKTNQTNTKPLETANKFRTNFCTNCFANVEFQFENISRKILLIFRKQIMSFHFSSFRPKCLLNTWKSVWDTEFF